MFLSECEYITVQVQQHRYLITENISCQLIGFFVLLYKLCDYCVPYVLITYFCDVID